MIGWYHWKWIMCKGWWAGNNPRSTHSYARHCNRLQHPSTAIVLISGFLQLQVQIWSCQGGFSTKHIYPRSTLQIQAWTTWYVQETEWCVCTCVHVWVDWVSPMTSAQATKGIEASHTIHLLTHTCPAKGQIFGICGTLPSNSTQCFSPKRVFVSCKKTCHDLFVMPDMVMDLYSFQHMSIWWCTEKH